MSQTANEKLNAPGQPEIQPIPLHRKNAKPGQTMLIPNARVIDEFVRAIPYGQRIDVKSMRQALAAEYRTDITCPVTTGIQMRVVAEAALEAIADGKNPNDVTAFWRVLDGTSSAAKKLSCGPEFIASMRSSEGIT